MVAIRLARFGAKKKPTYRVVVMDKRRARDSKTIEVVGHYNPRPTPIELDLKRERIDYWLGVGAQPSDTVKRLVKFFDEHGANVEAPKRKAAQEAAAAKPAVQAPVPEKKEEEAATDSEAPAEKAEASEGSTEEAKAEEPKAEAAAPAEEPAAEEKAEEAAPAEEPAAEAKAEADAPSEAAEPAEEAKPEEDSAKDS